MHDTSFKKIVFKVFVGGSIIFILVVFDFFHIREFLKSNVYYHFTPILAQSSDSGLKFSKTLNLILNLPSLRDDIEKDKEKIFDLEAQNARLKNLEKENQKLRQMLDLPFAENVKKTIADVISKDFKAQEWLLINKGFSDGISKGDVVITAQNTLVGFIYKVNSHSAYVRLTTSEDNVFRVALADKEDIIAVAKGSHGNSIEVEYVDSLIDINVGDIFLYDNTDNKEIFLKKPAVGVVQDVIVPQDKLSKNVQLTPLYNISSLSNVIIFHNKI